MWVVRRMEIDVRTNGIHSMAEALIAFKRFHENPDDVFALKDAILRSHHALETLFKDILYQVNPALLVAEDRKVKEIIEGYAKFMKGEAATVLDGTITTNLEDAIERLRSLGVIDLEEREYRLFQGSIKELCSYRNRLQHLGISANPDIIGRILGIVLPRGIDILDAISRQPVEKVLGYIPSMLLGRPSLISARAKLNVILESPPSIQNYLQRLQDVLKYPGLQEFSD
jgi:hypothetical protein